MTTNFVKKLGVLLVLSLVVAVCVGAGAAADWTTYLGNDGRTGYTAEAGPQTNNTLWSVENPVPGLMDGYYQTPVVKDGKVYVSVYHYKANLPSVLCYNQKTGEEIWNTSLTGSGGGRAGIALTDDSLYVSSYDGSKNGQVFRLDLETGDILGNTPVIAVQSFNGLTATPLVVDDTIFINTIQPETRLYGYSLDLKTEKINITLPNATGSTYASVSTDGSTVYVPGDGGVMAFSTSGAHKWTADLNAVYADGGQVSTPVYSNDAIYVHVYRGYGKDGNLYSLDSKTGDENWNVTIAAVTMSSPAVSDSYVVVSTTTGIDVYTLDGTKYFSHNGIKASQVTPVIAGNTVYYGGNTYINPSNRAGVYAIDLNTKTELWSITPSTDYGMIEGSFAVADGKLYYGDGLKFYAIGYPITLFDNTVTLGAADVDVLLKDGTTKKVVAGNNAMAAIAASGIAYTVSDSEYGLYLECLNGVMEDYAGTGYSWAVYVNGQPATTGISGITLHDGDVLTLYYCKMETVEPYNYLIDEAIHVVNIIADVEEPAEIPDTADIMYDGTVILGIDDVDILLKDEVTKKVVAGNNAMAAIAASGLTYTVSDSEYGLYLEGLNGVLDDYAGTGYSWAVYVNGQPATTGISSITLDDGDILTLYYCKMDANWNYLTDEATHVVNIIAKTTSDFTITLKEGWNFISVPQVLADNADTAKDLFGNIDTDYYSILGFDGEAQEWVLIAGDSEIQPLMAYWIYSAEDSISVDVTYTTDLTTPASMKLYNGWNAVGISANEDITATQFLDPVENWRTLIPWNKETGTFDTGITKSDTTKILTRGTGNWLFVGEGDSIVGLTA